LTAADVTAGRVRPRPIPTALLGACVALVAIGVLAFVVGLASDPDTAWRAFHVNYLYWGVLAQGAICLSATFVIVGARWPGPVRHLAESLGAWVPLTVVFFLIGFLGRESIYSPWLHGPPPGKEGYLSAGRLFWMDLGILVWLAALSVAYLYYSFRPALGGVAAAGGGSGLLRAWASNWQGDDAERERCGRKLQVLAPIVCLSFALGWSFIAFDQVMSLTPTWFSNLFGAYFAWGGFLSAVCATALLAILHQRSLGFEGQITKDRLHDLGKMIFAFSIFWMYLFFSQYLVIWYGNLPEETQFLDARLGSQFMVDKSGINELYLSQTWAMEFFWERLKEPYAKLSMLVWACCWIVPFWVLLGQRPKRTPIILGSVSAISLFGFWLERNVLVWPSLVPMDTLAFLGFVQVGIAAGFLGAFALVFLVFSRRLPSLPAPQKS
jgi:hypothetical protein